MNNRFCVSDRTERSCRKREMDVGVLSAEERAYLLGLYFADGWITERRNCDSTTLNLIMQGNELEIVNRVAQMVRRAGLRPVTYFSKRDYSITLFATARNLLSVFGGKKGVCSPHDNAGLMWMKGVGGLEVPFIAGLLDGDGCVRARLVGLKTSIFGCLQGDWVFSQTRYLFLVDFVYEYVNSLVAGGAVILVSNGGRKKRVLITASGREALLRGGVAMFSCKVAWFLRCAEKIRGKINYLRSRFLTAGQVARRLGVYVATVDAWCRAGYVKHMLFRCCSCKGHGGYRYIIPVEETERLEAELLGEREIADRAEANGAVRLIDVAKMLNIHRNTLGKWVHLGKLHATLVVKGRKKSVRGGIKYYMIPRDEVERLKRELMKSDDR